MIQSVKRGASCLPLRVFSDSSKQKDSDQVLPQNGMRVASGTLAQLSQKCLPGRNQILSSGQAAWIVVKICRRDARLPECESPGVADF